MTGNHDYKISGGSLTEASFRCRCISGQLPLVAA